MAHQHAPGFLALVRDAMTRVQEISIDDYRAREAAGESFLLFDVREDHEWERRRIPGAVHLGRGIIERDIENTIADKAAPIVLYCGGGYRSALACDALQKMGYTNVRSLARGIRGWLAQDLAVDEPEVG